MLLGPWLGRRPHFVLLSEVGGLASRGKRNAQNAPGLPWVVSWNKKGGSEGADHVLAAPEEALGLTYTPAVILPKPWT